MPTPVLPPPPIETPLVGPDGKVTMPWAQWLRQVWDSLRALS
jgi:hypothetical protein